MYISKVPRGTNKKWLEQPIFSMQSASITGAVTILLKFFRFLAIIRMLWARRRVCLQRLPHWYLCDQGLRGEGTVWLVTLEDGRRLVGNRIPTTRSIFLLYIHYLCRLGSAVHHEPNRRRTCSAAFSLLRLATTLGREINPCLTKQPTIRVLDLGGCTCILVGKRSGITSHSSKNTTVYY